MSVKTIFKDELRRMEGSEGLILQGCGGSLDEWVDGINDMLTEDGILLDGTRFHDCSTFEHDGVTCLLFPFREDVKLDVGKLAMQNVFSQYLFAYYNKESAMQGFVTTHSHEVVRNSRISQLRVLRQVRPFECCLYDLHKFIDELIKPNQELKDLIEFYDGFYAINFPDIIFADKVILYEGDTERMLIKNVLLSERFETLRNQYISFVQVGGAYAINYKPILEYLNVKSLIITDLDYKKEAETEADVRQSSSTNATINAFTTEALNESAPTVQALYSWKDSSGCIVSNNICLEYQGQTDGYARTLEEAMLAKRYNVSVLDTKTKEEWTSLRENDKLRFVIPQKADSCSIRTIVQHTSKNKTDFMYSVILNKLVDAMLPNYIEEGLMWLAN